VADHLAVTNTVVLAGMTDGAVFASSDGGATWFNRSTQLPWG